MAIQGFDELNILENGLYEIPEESMRSMPYEKYFGDMPLTIAQVDERIHLANVFEDALIVFMLLMMSVIDYDYSPSVARDALVNSLALQSIGDDEYRQNLATTLADSTLEHSDNPWFWSYDRVMFDAENESNTVLNEKDFLRAVERGMRNKQWKGIDDRRERRTHRALNDKIIPITEYFNIGKARGLYPKDISSIYSTLPSHPEETINCRCGILYLP